MKHKLLKIFMVCFFCTASMAFAQNNTITGTVTSQEDGLPVPGATIKVKGTTIGGQTNANGKYTLSVPSGATLIFSFIGYTTQTITVGTQTTIDVALVSDAKALSEVVVTANAIVREKRSLGYSAPVIKNEELTESGSPSVLTSLTGKVAGVNITSSSNTPGSSSRIVLRGGSSIAGNNQALIVIDGLPIDNSSQIGGVSSSSAGPSGLSSVDFGNRGNDVNPDDIASVTVLKGPAAAALYGSRASNGALIITTKSGKKNADKTSITFNTGNTFSSILKLPDFQNEYGQGYYTSIDNGVATYFNDPRENGSWGAPFTGAVQPWGQEIDGVQQKKAYSAVKNNIRDFFDTGFATDNNLSFSGGGEKSTFFLALSALNSDGIFPGNNDTYNKYGVRFNGNTEFSNKFSAGISINYNKINANEVAGGQGGSSVYNNLLQTPRDIPVTQLKDLNNKYNSYGYTDANGVSHPDAYGYYGAYTVNPYWILQNYKNLDDVSRITGNVNLGYKPLNWLNIQERVGVDNYSERRRIITPKYNFVPADTETGNYSAEDNLQTSNGAYEIDQFNVTEFVHDLMITGTHKFGNDFNASLMVGNNIRIRETNTNITTTNTSGGLVVPDWYNLTNSNGPVFVALDNISKRRLVGLYADLNLSYKSLLFLEATARNDWSSTLPVENNSFFYPSVSGSFVFSELLKSTGLTDILSYGKLRSSWAQVGNDTDPYQLLNTFGRTVINGNFGNTTFPFNGVPGVIAGTTIGNAQLKPEKTNSFEIGTELGFLDGRISADFSYYKNKSKNQILTISIPNSTGYAFAVVNAGELQNKGVEASLRGTVIKSSNVTWELYGTYTKNDSKVNSLLPGIDQITVANGAGFSGLGIVAAVGRSYGQFYAVTNQTDDKGRTIVSATTGRPLPTAKAQYLGSYNPNYQASWGTNLRYKQLTLNVLFDTKQGGKFFSRTKDITGFNGTSAETGGVRIGAIYPNSVYLQDGAYVANTTVTYNKQDLYTGGTNTGVDVIDASYVKLRSAGLAYTFTQSQLRHTPFGGLTIGLFGNNLFLWTAKENKFADPEVNSSGAGNAQGFDFTAQPSVRNYGINVKVSF